MAKQQVARTEPTAMPAIVELRTAFEKMDGQFKAALPPHIPVARFVRVVMTALQNNPRLLRCSRQSLFNAAMKAAQDGLLPDGREGAIVPYNDSDAEGPASENAQWLPMIAGIRKKVRNAGTLADWNVQVVQDGDEFDYELGDNPYIRHKPAARGGRTRKVLFAYSIATFPDGTKSREVMNVDQIEDIRKKSRAKKGPWSDPVFYPEMCRKTVARLHAKQLPQSTDLDTLLRRDDDLYDLKGAGDTEETQRQRRLATTQAALDHFAGDDQESAPAVSDTSAGQEAAPDAGESVSATSGPESGAAQSKPTPAQTRPPKSYDEYRAFFDSVLDRATNADELHAWFWSEAQRRVRNAAGIIEEERRAMADLVEARVKALGGRKEGL